MSPSKTGRCYQTREWRQPTNESAAWRHGSQSQLYSFFCVVDLTLTHLFWLTGWEVISKFPSHSSLEEWQNVSILPGIHLLKCSPVTDRAEECGGDQVPRAPATSLLQCAEQSFYKSGALNISPHQHPRSRSRGFLLLIKIV